MGKGWIKGALTIVGAVFFSTLGIFASDTLQGIGSGVSNMAGIGASSVCGAGAVAMQGPRGVLCVDIYEASPSAGCPVAKPSNPVHTEQNANAVGCGVASVSSAAPWTFVSLPQAQRMCAASGKRLPTSDEWYRIALGTQQDACITNAKSPGLTGTTECISAVGVYDTIGNVWEWVDASVQGNMFGGRALPKEGHVSSVDADGIAISSSEVADEMYGKDYFWSKEEGVFGMIRGGFYSSREDAGLYTVNASVATSFASQGVGFRCVKDVL